MALEDVSREDLTRLDLLRGVELDAFAGIIGRFQSVDIRQGDVLLEAGQRNNHLYLLVSGRLRVHLTRGDEPLAILEPGETAGEISIVDGQPTSAHVIADADSRLLKLDEHQLWSLVRGSHQAAYNLLLILAQRLRRDNAEITRTRELQRQWERYATIDCLTGLFNRRWLDANLGKMASRCQEAGSAFSVVAIDIDAFKPYNDTHGHSAGDRVLFTVASNLARSLRPGDLLARHGGDEFIALLPQSDLSLAMQIARRLHAAASGKPVETSEGGSLPSVTISLGVAQFGPGDSPETVLDAADRALYLAKGAGRNCVASCDGS